jgi:hypothetical protein
MSEEIKGEAWLDERYRWHFKAGNYRVSEDPSCGVTGIEYAFFGPQGEMSDEDVVRKLATLDAENATLNKRIAELETALKTSLSLSSFGLMKKASVQG